ncbi:hypothetical protein ABGT17_07410 [Rossellomorea marisflavi]
MRNDRDPARMRRLDFLPVESKGLQRRGTDPSPSPFLHYREALMIVSLP